MANGKGSLRRPGREISQAAWDAIFRKPQTPPGFEIDRTAFELPPGDYAYFEWQPAPTPPDATVRLEPFPLQRPAEPIALPPRDE